MDGTRFEGQSHEQWPIASVLTRFGWSGEGRRHGRWIEIRCPFHADRNASAGYNVALNIFRCQACDAKGNSVTLVMQQMGFDAARAVEWLGAPATTAGVESIFEQPAWRRR